MTWVLRRIVVPLVPLIASAAFTACSSGDASGAVGTSGAGPALLAVDTTQGSVVFVENLSDQPLVDITIGLKAGIMTFSETIPRLEPKEKRQLRHNDFSSRDGTAFSLRVARPREVLITARDIGGAPIEMAQPY